MTSLVLRITDTLGGWETTIKARHFVAIFGEDRHPQVTPG